MELGKSNKTKKCSQSDKVGRHKYTLQILNWIESKLGSLDRRLGTIERTYKASVDFDRPSLRTLLVVMRLIGRFCSCCLRLVVLVCCLRIWRLSWLALR